MSRVNTANYLYDRNRNKLQRQEEVKSCAAATQVARANILYEFFWVWADPDCILWPLALSGSPVSSDELRATEKVMTCTMLRVGLIIKAASVGIGPCVSGSALQRSNTSEISSLSQLGKDKLMIQCGRQMKLIFPVADRNRLYAHTRTHTNTHTHTVKYLNILLGGK